MHEVSLATGLAAAVARACPDRTVRTVHVDVGQLRQVVPESLRYAWTFAVRSTALDGSALVVREVAAELVCEDCGARGGLGRELGFGCRGCGSARTRVVAGDRLVLVAVDVDDGPVVPRAEADPGDCRRGDVDPLDRSDPLDEGVQ